MLRLLLRLAMLSLPVLLVLSIISAQAASVRIPQSNLGRSLVPITANDLKPPECAGLNLTAVSNNGSTNIPTLILGTSATENLRGRSTSDCIVGGSGNDTLRSNGGQSILIGGTGSDTLRNAAVCYGSASSTFINCGTIIIR